MLLVKPTDDDRAIRHRYYALAKGYHPDRVGDEKRAEWEVTTLSYDKVNTAGKRLELHRLTEETAGVCAKCQGSGVTWSRLKPRAMPVACAVCGGTGYAG